MLKKLALDSALGGRAEPLSDTIVSQNWLFKRYLYYFWAHIFRLSTKFMAYPNQADEKQSDPNASERKKDHIDLAFKSKVSAFEIDQRFYYEPILAAHPHDDIDLGLTFLGKTFKAPIWVSSMTGGTSLARIINKNLAIACGEFGLGMGLGSCRQLLHSDEFLEDFNVRKYMVNQPLYINLGIAQIEQLLDAGQTNKIIIHVNPMQEWLQPEGDRFMYAPMETVKRMLDKADYKIIVKEVGQGMGPKSIKSLLSLPIEALDFAANGGTNFALLEILRSSEIKKDNYHKLANIGHSAEEMISFANQIYQESPASVLCKQIIVSGGVSDFLDGYYHIQKSTLPMIYGQASGFLKYAMDSYETLQNYVDLQIKGLSLAKTFLTAK
jgi:isopentenyl-diphosphate Delta-isomerase